MKKIICAVLFAVTPQLAIAMDCYQYSVNPLTKAEIKGKNGVQFPNFIVKERSGYRNYASFLQRNDPKIADFLATVLDIDPRQNKPLDSFDVVGSERYKGCPLKISKTWNGDDSAGIFNLIEVDASPKTVCTYQTADVYPNDFISCTNI